MKKKVAGILLLLAFLFPMMLSMSLVSVAKAENTESTNLYAGTTNPGIVYKYAGDNTWNAISPSLGWSVTSLVEYSGSLYAAVITGNWVFSSVGKVYRYDVDAWTDIGTLDQQVCFLIVYKGDLYAGTAINSARLYKFIPETTS